MMDPPAHIEAASNGEVQLLRKLLTDENKNEVDDFNRTALQHAVWQGHLDCVEVLLEKGADTNIRNKYETTAGFIAISNDRADILLLLLDAGAKCTIQDLKTCYEWDSNKCAKILLDRGFNVPDPMGLHTPRWVYEFKTKRLTLRKNMCVLIGIGRFKLSPFSPTEHNLMKVMAKHGWSDRLVK